jgi:superfamily II DNA or RNA helicase
MYLVEENVVERPCKIPFSYGVKSTTKHGIKTHRPSRSTLDTFNHVFEGNLRPNQKECRTQIMDLLRAHKSVMMACYTGFGKTVTAINVANKIKLKTLIAVPKKPLLAQWSDEIRQFLPNATVTVIDPNKLAKLTAETNNVPDFAIVNACNIHKISCDFLKHYGFVIVDEAHLQMTEKLSQNLLHLTPRYLLGITATPYREDGYDVLFNLFFGDKKVSYNLNKKHTVYKVKTNFKPDETKILTLDSNYKPTIRWSCLLDEQSKDKKRNNLIIKIVKHFKDRTFLILVKRIQHGTLLMDNLVESGESVTSLLGKQQDFDPDARILIGTNSKIGTGFNHPKLDALLCACDVVSYYIQFIGRIMRRVDVDPIIFDLVDSHHILKKHFQKRLKIYMAHGGQLVDFEKNLLVSE